MAKWGIYWKKLLLGEGAIAKLLINGRPGLSIVPQQGHVETQNLKRLELYLKEKIL